MQAQYLRVREELGASGELGEGYIPRMHVVSIKNAARLRQPIRTAWVAREAFGQRLAPPCLLAGPRPGNGMNYWFGYYRKHPRENPPAIVLRIWKEPVRWGGLRL